MVLKQRDNFTFDMKSLISWNKRCYKLTDQPEESIEVSKENTCKVKSEQVNHCNYLGYDICIFDNNNLEIKLNNFNIVWENNKM
jgi:hypothetical protein